MNQKGEKERFLEDTDAESRLNYNIQRVEMDLKERIQKVEADLKEDIQIIKNDLEKNIDDIKTTLSKFDERLRKVENSSAESRGRKMGFSVVKDWIIAFCAIAALIVSIIAFFKSNGG